jgi:hypothetical protein
MKAHSAAIRLTTSSAVNIGGIPLPSDVPQVFCRVIPEIDTRRAANLMLERYGEKAEAECATRTDELAAVGDQDGVAVWRRITDAVAQLANTTPPRPVH